MAFTSTSMAKKYALNPELMADKHPNIVDLIEELQSAVEALEVRVEALENV